MTTVVSYNDQEPNHDDDDAGHERFIIPRTAMPMVVVRRYHHRDYRPPLALPPSTNCPASFEEMYRLATTAVDWSAGGGRGGGGVVQQQRKTRRNGNNNGHSSTDDDDDSDSSLSSSPALLQEDVIPQILSYCDAITLSRASCVCRSWHILANSDDLWTGLCKEVFGILPHELRPPPDPTRILYILSYLKLRETLSFGRGGSGGGGGMSSRRSINDGIQTIFNVG